ncbi:carbohydrate kinase family protein [Actinocrispum wychmicini]|uniref:Sugar/nucleoside kinase (Ribokinase family) n=1 Tax=Actinocrispum wychmicini TaxID=1213861 RepID=A0A4R2J5A6_9PSEU|nr:sugar kinase [Actinocrispum wychmicini]TCO52532.1 sugar/nucleoside kinase (ribokinase family) [Actinocrispum wychmicini]
MTILVVGDAGLDVIAMHDKAITYGDDTRAQIRITTGGAGANTASWLAALGAEVALVTRVGDDTAGQQVLTELTMAGVRCVFTVDPNAATCCVVVLVGPDGQRTMLPDHGAGALLRPEDLTPELVRTSRHLHLSGYVLLDPQSRDTGLAMLDMARDAGLTTSVDPQSAVLLTDPAAFLEWIRGVDLLLPNKDELSLLSGAHDPLDFVGAIAVTSGAHGASWVDHVTTVSVPAEQVSCVDSTGGGDAFNAGLLLAWLSGEQPESALRSGVGAATRAVGSVGATPR